MEEALKDELMMLSCGFFIEFNELKKTMERRILPSLGLVSQLGVDLESEESMYIFTKEYLIIQDLKNNI